MKRKEQLRILAYFVGRGLAMRRHGDVYRPVMSLPLRGPMWGSQV